MAEDLHVQVDERARELAAAVLDEAGVSLDTAINRYLCAIAVTKSLPYKEDIRLPDDNPKEERPRMSLEELGRQIAQGHSEEQSDLKRLFAEIERRYGL